MIGRNKLNALRIKAIDIPLADPHFWTMQGPCAYATCPRLGRGRGVPLNNISTFL